MKKLAGVLFALSLSGLLLAQQGLTGAWQGTTPGGAPVALELAAKGADLTGTMKVREQAAPIQNGSTSGNGFRFTASLDGGTEAFTGEFAGDEMKLWMDDRGPASAITLKRATPARRN